MLIANCNQIHEINYSLKLAFIIYIPNKNLEIKRKCNNIFLVTYLLNHVELHNL